MVAVASQNSSETHFQPTGHSVTGRSSGSSNTTGRLGLGVRSSREPAELEEDEKSSVG
jgi:hypothetical protein